MFSLYKSRDLIAASSFAADCTSTANIRTSRPSRSTLDHKTGENSIKIAAGHENIDSAVRKTYVTFFTSLSSSATRPTTAISSTPLDLRAFHGEHFSHLRHAAHQQPTHHNSLHVAVADAMQQGMLLQRPVFKMNPTNEFWDQARVSPQTPTNTLQAAAAAAAAAVANSASLNRANSLANSSHAAATPTSANGLSGGGAAGLGGGAGNASINQSNMMAMLPPPTKTEPMNSAAPNTNGSVGAASNGASQNSASGGGGANSGNGSNPRRTPDANCNPNMTMTTFNNTADTTNANNTNASNVDNQSMDTSNMANQNNMVAINNLNNMNNMVTLPDPKIMTEKLVSELQVRARASDIMYLEICT
ncbi:hypothetical protein V9T40_011851 [Parthenolecanium corni]|uniref:Uncharacterized protein n=1 Tax=Parthenolecanium corni TaxID=536013 RepID=A0AAN9XZW7_9HEMI